MRAPNAYDVSSDAYYERVDAEGRERLRHINDETNAVTARFGLTNKQAELVKMSMKPAQEPKPPEIKNKNATIFEQHLETEKKLLAEEEANKQRGRAIIEKSQQSKEEERQQTAKERQIYEMYLPMSEERKRNNAETEASFDKAKETFFENIRKEKENARLQTQIINDLRAKGMRDSELAMTSEYEMSQRQQQIEEIAPLSFLGKDWRSEALYDVYQNSMLFAYNEDLRQDKDYLARVQAGQSSNPFLNGGGMQENVVKAEGWGWIDPNYLTEGSKYLTQAEKDRLSYMLSFTDDPVKMREAKDYQDYLEYVGRQRYEFIRNETGNMKNRGGAAADAYIGGVENSLQGIVASVEQFFGNKVAPTKIISAEQVRAMDDIESSKGLSRFAKASLYAVGNMTPMVLMGKWMPTAKMSQVASFSTMFGGTWGNAYEEAMADWKKPSEARAYATLSAASETLMQYGIGRVTGMAAGVMRTPPMVNKVITSLSKHPYMQRGMNVLSMLSGEVFEEHMQLVLQPLYENIAYGTNKEIKLIPEGSRENFAVTVLTSLLMGGARNVKGLMGDIQTVKRNVRLSDGTFLSSDLLNRVYYAVSNKIAIGEMVTDQEVELVNKFAEQLDEKEIEFMAEQARRISMVKMGVKTYGEIEADLAALDTKGKYDYLSNLLKTPEFWQSLGENRQRIQKYNPSQSPAQKLVAEMEQRGMKALADKTGMQIEQKAMDGDIHGMLEGQNNTLTLNTNSEKSQLETVIHEVVHTTKDTKGYEGMKQAAVTWFESLPQEKQQSIQDITQESYSELSDEQRQDELTSKFVSEIALNPVQSMNLAYENPNTATVLLSSLNTAIKKIGQDKAGKAILDAKNNLTKALYEVKRGGGVGNMKPAIQYDKGKSFDGVDGNIHDIDVGEIQPNYGVEPDVDGGDVESENQTDENVENHESDAYNKSSKLMGLEGFGVESYIVIAERNPVVVNAEFKNEGVTQPPYDINYIVKLVEAGNEKYVRVFHYHPDNTSNMLGGWIMRLKDIEGLTAEEIADKYSLPKVPTHMCDVILPSDFILQMGIAGPVSEWGRVGGGLQFDTFGKDLPKEVFKNKRKIE